jgi:hypothetical protein
MDDQTIAEMARRGTFCVLTIDHNRYYVEYRQEFGYNSKVADRLNGYIQRNLETAKRAHEAGAIRRAALTNNERSRKRQARSRR